MLLRHEDRSFLFGRLQHCSAADRCCSQVDCAGLPAPGLSPLPFFHEAQKCATERVKTMQRVWAPSPPALAGVTRSCDGGQEWRELWQSLLKAAASESELSAYHYQLRQLAAEVQAAE